MYVYSYLKSVKIKYIGACILIVVILEFFGAFTHIFELDFNEDFQYPMKGDIKEYVLELRGNQKPSVPPINTYNYSFLSTSDHKCKGENGFSHLQLVYIVKSAIEHFDRRKSIRNSWGFEARFSDVPIRTVFVLGIHPNNSELQSRVDEEQKKFKDIVQATFVDAYFNNTIKTMMGFQWAVTFCPRSKFYMFSDDDMYVSTKNVLRFVRNPTNYPQYLDDPVYTLKKRRERRSKYSTDVNRPSSKNYLHSTYDLSRRKLNQVLDFELEDDVRLLAGFVFLSAPHRHKSSKWHVTLAEYPYHMWPPYVTAGAYIVSREALHDMYYASFYTQHFRFDDIYLGLVAKKVDIEPYHCEEFHFYKKSYDLFAYRYVIASHGYSDPKELIHVWNEQKGAGNA